MRECHEYLVIRNGNWKNLIFKDHDQFLMFISVILGYRDDSAHGAKIHERLAGFVENNSIFELGIISLILECS